MKTKLFSTLLSIIVSSCIIGLLITFLVLIIVSYALPEIKVYYLIFIVIWPICSLASFILFSRDYLRRKKKIKNSSLTNNDFITFCLQRNISQELKSLLSVVYNQIHSSEVNLQLLKESLTNLLLFLSKPENCTNANCKAVDLFFTIDDHWNKKWDDLPENYQHILNDIGGCLHDTISNPDIAKNFYSTPKELLERIEKLDKED